MNPKNPANSDAARFAVLEAAVHPPRCKLDALAAGDADARLSAHVDYCADCTQYVADLRAEIGAASEFAAPAAEAFSQQIERPEPRAAEVIQLHAARPSRTRFQAVGYAVTACALAAGLALFVRTSRPELEPSGATGPSAAHTNEPTLATTQANERFKGGASVAIVRESGGVQSRATGPTQLKSYDRIRLEVTTPGGLPLAAGVLSETGAYFALVPAEELAAGTHFSQASMRFDAEPFRGWVVWGPPDKIIEVQRTRDVQSVQFLAISVAP